MARRLDVSVKSEKRSFDGNSREITFDRDPRFIRCPHSCTSRFVKPHLHLCFDLDSLGTRYSINDVIALCCEQFEGHQRGLAQALLYVDSAQKEVSEHRFRSQ